MPPFTGSGVFLITPFTEDGSAVNYDVLEQLIEFHLLHQTDALFCFSPCGEVSSLSPEERTEYLSCITAKTKQRLPLFFDVSFADAARLSPLLRELEAADIQGILAAPPGFQRLSQRCIAEYYRSLAELTSLPVIALNGPAFSPAVMTARTLAEVIKAGSIAAFADGTRNFPLLTEVLSLVREDFPFYCAASDVLLPALALGACGGITLGANLTPRSFHDLIQAAHGGQWSEARALSLHLAPLYRLLASDAALPLIKYGLQCLNYRVGDCRPPLLAPEATGQEAVQRLLKGFGLLSD